MICQRATYSRHWPTFGTDGASESHRGDRLSESCRASVAIDKTLAQAIAQARADGMSWQTIGRTLGATDHAENLHQLIDALATNRRAVLRQLFHDAD